MATNELAEDKVSYYGHMLSLPYICCIDLDVYRGHGSFTVATEFPIIYVLQCSK